MNIKEWLRNYRKNCTIISMAEATGKINKDILALIEEKKLLDIAIDHLTAEHKMAITEHYILGKSYERISSQNCFVKSTIKKRADKGVKMLQTVLDEKFILSVNEKNQKVNETRV